MDHETDQDPSSSLDRDPGIDLDRGTDRLLGVDAGVDVDRSQPWQTQYAERFSRSVNDGSPWVRRQLRLALAWFLALAASLVLLFLVMTAWHAAFG